MSSAFYPLGMKSYNNYTPQGGYKTWKGSDEYQNPTGITSGNQRPQTNKDYRNIAVYKQGSARPMKHYRKGISIPYSSDDKVAAYYSDVQVKSSTSNNMIGQLIDRPGSVIMKDNGSIITDGSINDANCNTCLGQAVVSNWAPINNLTEKPQANTMNASLCCNAQKKAKKRVQPASTILKKNYYTTHSQYLYNRCQTFEQKSFNFYSGPIPSKNKPGGPESYSNSYVANCNPNVLVHDATTTAIINRIAYILKEESIITEEEYDAFKTASITTLKTFVSFLQNEVINAEQSLALLYKVLENSQELVSNSSNGCKIVVYKPNNHQYAQQGAVSNGSRLLRLNVNTINQNIADINNIVYKNKTGSCDPALYRKSGDHVQCARL
jgi:hypothetical protein